MTLTKHNDENKGTIRIKFKVKQDRDPATYGLWVDITGTVNRGFLYGSYHPSGSGVERQGWDKRSDFFWNKSGLDSILESEKKSVISQYRGLGYKVVVARPKKR